MKQIFLIGLSILVLLILASAAYAQSQGPAEQDPVVLTDDQAEYPLGLHLDILEDPSGELTIADVFSPRFDTQFVPSQMSVPNFGFTSSAYWVRFRLDNQTRQTNEWLLEQGFANTHYVDLYSPTPNGEGFTVKQTGVLRPPAARDVSHPRIVIKLMIPPESQQTIYLRFQNGASMTLPLTLWTQEAFLNNALLEQIANGIFFGVLIGLLFYNLFLLFSLQDRNYLYFVILLASLIVEEASYDGYLGIYVIPNLNFIIKYAEPLSFAMLTASMIVFSDSFLEIKSRLPKLHTVNLGFLACWGLLAFLSLFASYHFIANLMAPWALLSLLVIFIAGIASWLRGFRPARFFMIAWLGLLTSISWVLLVRLGLTSSTFLSENAFRLGYLWMAVCWSIALADRINLLKAETEKANVEVQASETRYRQLVETMNDGLGVIDENGRYTYVNNRLAEMLGFSPNEIIGHLVTEFADEDNRKILANQLEKRKTGVDTPYELIWRKKGESELITLISPVPLFDNGASYKGAFAVVTDITERVRASRLLEQRVEERTRELSTLLGISRDISASQDLSVVLNRILKRLKAVVAYHGWAILAEEEGKWRIQAQDWPSLPAEPEPMELSSSEMQVIVKDLEPGVPILIRSSDLEEANVNGFATIATRLSRGCIPKIHCWLGVPLVEKGSIFGAMILGCEEVGVSEDQVKVIVASANQAALAIENNRLYQQMREALMSEERNRLARDLHDSVTQLLFSANLLAEVLPKIWRRDPEQGLQRLVKLQQLIGGALAEMRTLLLELRPSAVVKTPLGELLAQLTEAVTSRSGLPFQLYIEQIPSLPEDVHTNIYRIAQEALNNVVKHAQAKQVTVSLSTVPLPAPSNREAKYKVKLVIRDDGVGYTFGNGTTEHLGIGIMRERSAAIQADFSLDSRPGYGTRLTLIWPNQQETSNG